MKRSEIYFSSLLVPIDFLALLGGFVVAYMLRDLVDPTDLAWDALPSAVQAIYAPIGTLVQPFSDYLRYVLYITPVMIVIFAVLGLYSIRSATPWSHRFLRVLLAVSVGEAFIMLLFLVKKEFFIPRSTVILSWVLCALFVTMARYLVRLVQKLLYRYNIGAIRVAVIGKNAVAKKIMRDLAARPNSTYKLVERLDSLSVSQLLPQISNQTIDELIVAGEDYTTADLIALRNHCLEKHVTFSFVPGLLAALQSSFVIRSEVGVPMIEVQPTPLEGWGRVMKRSFDIVGSLVFITILSPVFLGIAIWLKLASPGPLIYKQRRIGKDRMPIEVWKFRSMKVEYCTGMGYDGDAYLRELLAKNPDLAKEWEETQKLKNDPRISAPGRFLRATSLDELPQFFNVLGGTLSLVGPRPIVEEEVRKYGEVARILFSVKPGITGPWQVAGRSDLTMKERGALSATYIEHWHLGRDIAILWKTILMMLRRGGEGAY